jgi:biotin--protein ligase
MKRMYRNPILLYGLPTPFLSLATFQLAGRGRGKNQWLSPPGCLQFSLLLKLPRGFPANKVVFAQYIAALAICQGLDEDGKLGVRIKWPNDIYAEAAGIGSDNAEQALDSNGRPKKSRSKLGGILVNSSYVKGEWHLVVGCGINILNDLPTTSLAQLHELRQKQHSSTQKAVLAPTMESSLARILVAFEEIWTRFVAERSFASFIDEYTGRWLHT